ncbi:MAG TPA: GNAT family N-acetyltransferase [Acidimicrobiales bacterium]|jgi:ribosomal protein S18 acetylase RimI-like enzyme|nr:GNAT family N-acetyltransferase [Acidimicrobiales bacterium]
MASTDHTGEVSFSIRGARITDMPALQGIYERASLSNPQDAGPLLDNPEWLVFTDDGVREGRTRVAVDRQDEVVGFASYRIAGGVAELEDLFVEPARMRRGLGEALVRDISATLLGLSFATLEVTANPQALAFYERLGFVTTHQVATELHRAAPRMVRPTG